ncbi:MAG: rane glycosyltransferase, partial [Pseudomonadota bacterium]|nr:rane glycosyltransferase [Pseudomonadota bacterium]
LPALALSLPMLALALGTPATSERPERPVRPAVEILPDRVGAATEVRRLDVALSAPARALRKTRPVRRHRPE